MHIEVICTGDEVLTAVAAMLKRSVRTVDYVLRKALRPEADERYPSVDAFANDIRALLESRPVDARSGDRWYRVRKFLSRHRVAATAALIIVGSLSAGLYVVNRERTIAERRFQEVRELANKFIALDGPLRELPGTTKVRSQIVSESLVYLERLGQEARGDAELSLEIGNAYLQVAEVQGVPLVANLGDYAEAEETLKKADSFVDSVLASDGANRRALFSSARIQRDWMALVDMQDRRISKIGAMGTALSNMSMNTGGLAGQNRIGFGAGVQGGQAAFAVGFQHAFNGNRASVSISGSFTNGESSAGVGGGLSW